MSKSQSVRTLSKRLLFALAATIGVVLICVFAVHLFVNQMYRGIASHEITTDLAFLSTSTTMPSAGCSCRVVAC